MLNWRNSIVASTLRKAHSFKSSMGTQRRVKATQHLISLKSRLTPNSQGHKDWTPVNPGPTPVLLTPALPLCYAKMAVLLAP